MRGNYRRNYHARNFSTLSSHSSPLGQPLIDLSTAIERARREEHDGRDDNYQRESRHTANFQKCAPPCLCTTPPRRVSPGGGRRPRPTQIFLKSWVEGWVAQIRQVATIYGKFWALLARRERAPCRIIDRAAARRRRRATRQHYPRAVLTVLLTNALVREC